MATIAETKEYEVLALEVMPDHVHLFVSATPFDSPTGIVKVFKGVTALKLFKKFPELRNKHWRVNSGLPAIIWEPRGMSPLRRFRSTLRSREGLDAIHPPIKIGGLLATTL